MEPREIDESYPSTRFPSIFVDYDHFDSGDHELSVSSPNPVKTLDQAFIDSGSFGKLYSHC